MSPSTAPRLSVVRRSTLLAAITLVVPLVSAQTPASPQQPTPVFRAEAALVPIDVRVVDKNGMPITDLTQKDFTVFENGVRQEISQFVKQSLAARPVAAPAPALPRRVNQSTARIEAQDFRVFLLMLGRGNLRGPAEGIKGLIHLVRERLLPQDRVAVMAWNRATDFTTDHERIAQVLERFQQEQIGLDERLARYQTGLVYLFGDQEIPAFLQREIDAIFGGPEQMRTVKAAVTLQSAAVQAGLDRTASVLLMPSQADAASRLRANDLGMSFDQFTVEASKTIDDTQSLYTAIEYLRQIDGEKQLIWLQEYGVYFPAVEDDRSLGRAASDARIALSMIRAGGTETVTAGIAESRSGLPRSSGMATERILSKAVTSRKVAELTGGRYDANRLKDASLDADYIEQASRLQYVLGYTPREANWDGRFHDIKVVVGRPGATVLYRHGYFAKREVTPLDRHAAVSYSRISAAAEYGRPIPDLALAATATMSGKGEPREVRLDVRIDLSRVQFQPDGGTHHATVDVAAFCLDDRGRPLGDVWKTFELTASPDRLAGMIRDGAHVSLAVPVKFAASTVKLVAYDYGADLIGSANLNVKK